MASEKDQNYSRLSLDRPAVYKIRIKGELEKRMYDRMGGMHISRQTEGGRSIVTTLEGELIDQTALVGVLVALYNMRLPLISVEHLDVKQEDEKPLMKVKVNHKVDYIEFIVSGLQDDVSIPEPLETVLNACELAGLSEVLVDFRGLMGGDRENPEVEYARGVMQEYQKYLDAGGTPIKVAVVGKEEMIESWKVSEEIVRDHGLNVLVTGDYQEAIDWLRSDKEGQ